jgi:hypothetical protein
MATTFYYSDRAPTTSADTIITSTSRASGTTTTLIGVDIGDTVTSIGDFAFNLCTSLASIAIPDNVTTIGNIAFQDCTGLTSVSIGKRVTSIGNSAFLNCINLVRVIIYGNALTFIDAAAFYATNLTEITIPNSLTSLGISAFRYNANLIRVNFLGNAPSIGILAFDGTPVNLKIYRYSTKSGWSSTFGGKNVLLIDTPSKGLRTFGFPNISSGNNSIKKQNLGGGKIISRRYLYRATGVGLTPNINNLRFYDSGSIYFGKTSFFSEDNNYAIWYIPVIPFTDPYWVIGSKSEIGYIIPIAPSWGKIGATDNIIGSYPAFGDAIGTISISTI